MPPPRMRPNAVGEIARRRAEMEPWHIRVGQVRVRRGWRQRRPTSLQGRFIGLHSERPGDAIDAPGGIEIAELVATDGSGDRVSTPGRIETTAV
jgi:hypothetical protein